jgi:hypothetical protein
VQDFTGIGAKLKRADENIFYLHEQIALFFQEGDYPVLPKSDREEFLKAIQYHRNRIVPPRFSVLAGEIVHHLRSCFDHITWHFSVGATPEHKRIDFPVLKQRPANSEDRRSYKRKIELIQNVEALRLIETLQPYNASDPLDDPLWIINDFDIVDKHKELVLSVPSGSVFFSNEMKPVIESYQRVHPELDAVEIARKFQSYGTLMPYLSFRDFGRRDFQPVIPGLVDLFNYTISVVKGFEAL